MQVYLAKVMFFCIFYLKNLVNSEICCNFAGFLSRTGESRNYVITRSRKKKTIIN